jgi:hypothetical protein
MRAIYDLVDLRAVTLAARQIPYSDDTLENIFPSVNVDSGDIEYRLLQENLLQQIVPARAFDTPAPLIDRPGALEVRGGIPAFSAADLITETDSIRARRLAGLQVDLQPTVNASAARTTQTILNTMEVLRGMALYTGKVTLNANGVIQSADFNVPAANKVVAGTAWTTLTAPAVTDLDTWRQVYVNANGGAPGRMLSSRRVQRLLLRNTSVINGAVGAQMGRTQINPAELAGFLAAEDLPNLEVYDRQYGSLAPTSNLTRVIPDNVLIMLPPGPMGSTMMSVTEEAIRLVQAQVLAAAEAPGITVVTMVEDDPVQQAVKSAAIGMPVITQPYQLLIATLF